VEKPIKQIVIKRKISILGLTFSLSLVKLRRNWDFGLHIRRGYE